MMDLIVFILFVLGGNGGFQPSEIPAQYRFESNDGQAATAAEIEAACTGSCYDFWREYSVTNEQQAKDGGISDFIGAL